MKANNNGSFTTWPAVLLGIALLATPPVLAQDTGAGQAANEEAADQTTQQKFAGEITVTAQKREQQLQEVPIAIQALEGGTLEEVNIRDLNEVITLVPGASEELSNNVGLRRYQIRGVAQALGDSTVGYYLDDSAFFFYGQSFAPMGRTFDVERVEVLRGPQSTLYGNGSMGGTVRFITNPPNLSGLEAHLRSAYSSLDGGGAGSYLDAAVSVPLVENKLGLRLVGSYEDKGGYHVMPSAGLDETNPAEITNLRGSLLWAPSDRLTLRFFYGRNVANQDGSTLLASTDPPVASYLPGDYYDSQFDLYYGTLIYDFGAATLSSTTTYIDFTTEYQTSLPFPVPGGVLSLTGDQQADAVNNETRLVSNSGGPLQWLVGVFYSDTENQLIGDSNAPELLPYSVSKSTSESISVFGELSWAFLDGKLIPLVGLRYFTDDRATESTSALIPTEPATFDSVNPRFNLSYLPTDGSTYYLNVAKGFRSGGFNDPFYCTALHAGLGGLPCVVAVDSDELWSYEIGTKQSMADNQLLLDVALYYQDWQDIRQGVPFLGLYQDYQIGDAAIPGVDLQLVYTPAAMSGLSLTANANWNDAHFDAIDPLLAGASGASEGDRLPFVPEWTSSLTAAYGWTVSQAWMGQLSVGYTHLEPQKGQFGSDSVGDSRDLMRARFGFHNGSWGFFVFGNNLLNESGAIYAQTPVGGTHVFTRDYPRQIGLEVTFDLW